MPHWLCRERRGQRTGLRARFDPADWTVDFPRPAMAAATTSGDALRVDAVYYHKDELAGLIWEAEDRYDHPLLKRETARDFRGCRLMFRWRSGGLVPLDAVNGPVLTIEGRDAEGAARTWYVRLWNYASGTPEDAAVAIDFATVEGGFALPGEADPVWAGDIDRMFVSLPPAGYDAAGGAFASAHECWAELSELRCEGPGSVIEVGDAMVPEHGLRIANGYDDVYNLTPERVLRNCHALGYRGAILHYVGMSHYPRLEANSGGWYASLTGRAINAPTAAWHRDFAERARALGYDVIWSLSYELFDAYCWGDWKQRAGDGSRALTGWSPPSTLLSPANTGAMGYLQAVAAAFVAIAQEAGLPVRFQIGEPWWWTMPSGEPCLYDAAARAAFGGSPVAIPDVRGALSAGQKALLDQAGAALAVSTAALRDAVRALAADAEVMLLAYLPTVLSGESTRANLPVGWAAPAYDVLQLEDYDWCAAGDTAATARGIAAAETRLGYPVERQHYLAGFVLNGVDAGAQWPRIAAAADAARGRGVAETFVWALPQVLRDGFTTWDGEDAVVAFDDVVFPLAIGRAAEVQPGFATAIVTSAGGHEQRNAGWASARTRYDVGPGVVSEADVRTLLDFYRARLGPARAFRFGDPYDNISGGGATPSPVDEPIGTGDGTRTRFALVKRYGDAERRITRPVPGSVAVAVNGVATSAFAVEPGGWVALDSAPSVGAVVTAGFRFDVPVRFAEDSLSVSRATFLAGEVPSVPLIEVRED
jgi:uncharacterized protein (TIGR02217 family)